MSTVKKQGTKKTPEQLVQGLGLIKLLWVKPEYASPLDKLRRSYYALA